MSFGSFNQSYASRAPVATLAMKCKQQERIDKQIADYLAAGGQIHQFDLIRRDINGNPIGPVVPKQTKQGK